MAKTKAIAKREDVSILKFPELSALDTHFKIGLIDISARLSDRHITPVVLTETLDLISRHEKAVKKMADLAKKQLKALVQEHGEKVEGTTQIVASFGEFKVELRAQNTKLDGDKIQAMLNAKSISLEKGMDKQVSYVVNEGKLQELIGAKKITRDELESCRHELKYNLQSPKRVSDTEETESEEA